jgi:hypothetical protein
MLGDCTFLHVMPRADSQPVCKKLCHWLLVSVRAENVPSLIYQNFVAHYINLQTYVEFFFGRQQLFYKISSNQMTFELSIKLPIVNAAEIVAVYMLPLYISF